MFHSALTMASMNRGMSPGGENAGASIPIANPRMTTDNVRQVAATGEQYKDRGTRVVADTTNDVSKKYRAETEYFQVPVAPVDPMDTTVEWMQAIQDPARLAQMIPGDSADAKGLRKAILQTAGRSTNADVSGPGRVPLAGNVRLNTDAVALAEYGKRKAEVFEYNQFVDWTTNQFDLRDQTQLDMYNQIMPEVLEMREKQMDRQFDIAKALQKIQLRGAKKKDDYYLIWLLRTGKLSLDGMGAWVQTLDINRVDDPIAYKPGLFSPYTGVSPAADFKFAARMGPSSETGTHTGTDADAPPYTPYGF